jgi:proline dehydrogenase
LAESARDRYIELLRTLARDDTQDAQSSTISIKLSLLGQKIDRDLCLDNLRSLLTVAQAQNTFVRLDMEGSDITESTLSLFETVYPDFPDHVGIVLQAYLKRTARDIDRMCELNARVRLCKGAYKEPESIAHQSMDVIREHFIAYMKQLILHARYPAIATHDDLLIGATKQFVEEQGIDRSGFEFQMLYGMRPETQLSLVEEGYRMRIYVPYGYNWVSYFSRRLSERKENVWFVLKNLFRR